MLAAGASMARPAVPLDLGDPGLSPALLRTRLSAALLTNGTVDSLKSQLRAKVLSELRAGSGGGGVKQPRPVVEQAANHLIMDYLQSSGYLYTASVFAPESGVPVASPGTLSEAGFLHETQRLLDLLHIHPDSRLYRQMTSVRGSSAIRTLLEFVTHSSDQAPGVTNSSCQTSTDEAHTIERKMEQINERSLHLPPPLVPAAPCLLWPACYAHCGCALTDCRMRVLIDTADLHTKMQWRPLRRWRIVYLSASVMRMHAFGPRSRRL